VPMTVTALTMMHRYAALESIIPSDEEALREVASACVFVAAKVEEHTLRTNDLVNAVLRLSQGRGTATPAMKGAFPDLYGVPGTDERVAHGETPVWGQGGAGGAGQASGDGKGMVTQWLVGEAYYDAKATLLRNEQRILRAIEFRVEVEQPHQYAFNLCLQAHLSPACAQLAGAMVTDLLTLTTLAGSVAAASIGVGAVVAAMEVLGLPSEGVAEATGTDLGEVTAVCREIASLAEVSPVEC